MSEDQEGASVAAEWAQPVGGDHAGGECTWKVVNVLWLRKWHEAPKAKEHGEVLSVLQSAEKGESQQKGTLKLFQLCG